VSAAETKPAPGPEDDVHLSLRDHLIELRKRLLWAVIWLCVGFGLCWFKSQEIYQFLVRPVIDALPEDQRKNPLFFSKLTTPFFVYLNVALYAGLFLASPAILWQAWAFVGPGLYRHEKKKVLPFVAVATCLFLGGAAFCYYVILPPAFEFLLQSAGADMRPLLMMDEQLPLVMSLMLAFGIVFELPLIITILAMIGIVDVKFLTKYRRHAIVLNTLIAAIVTPTGDPFNLALMAVPMMACYELGVLGAWVFGKKKPVSETPAAS